MDSLPVVDLFTICHGAAAELFQEAQNKVNANIKDANTNLKKRHITLNFEYEPYADRSGAQVTCTVNTKLAARTGIDSSIILRRIDGSLQAFTPDTLQMDITFDSEPAPSERK